MWARRPTPHRAGWASFWRLMGAPFAELQEWGRWESPKSLRVYLDVVSTVTFQREALPHQPLVTWMEEDFMRRFPFWRGAFPFLP